jgi:PAS domain S-box-containing protein
MKLNRLSTALRVAPILALFVVAMGLAVYWADRDLRQVLIQQARLVAQSVNTDHVKSLTGTEADLIKPDYLRLTEQVKSICSANTRWRWMYLMGRRSDGAVFFYLDSESASSPDHVPPGLVNEEATEAFRTGFASGQPTIVGPYSDRWGTWITALVPLTDPKTKTVLAVLGMDIVAVTWKRDVAAKAALPVGLLLVLLIGGFVARAAHRPITTPPKPILKSLFPPLAAIVILLVAGTGALLWNQHRQHLAGDLATLTSDVSGDLHVVLNQQAAGLAAALQPITTDATVQKALHEGDTNRLLSVWRPVFDRMNRENHLTHFYFFDAHRVCLLRVHKPDQHGDLINRFTALTAERTGRTASGIELGPRGTFTLRVVQPVFAGTQLVGYVELGKEIEDALQVLHYQSGNHLAVLIHKEFLNRPAWEAGMRLLGRETDWDRLPHSVVIYASQGRLPDPFASWACPALDSPAQGTMSPDITIDRKDWRLSLSPLKDVSGAEVGDLLLMSDLTSAQANFVRLTSLSGTVGGVLLTLLLGFIYILLRHTDAGISAQEAELRESEVRYRMLFNHALDAINIVDLSNNQRGKILLSNPAAAAMHGYTPTEMEQMRITDFDTPESAAQAPARFNQIAKGESILGESLHVRKDGSVFPIEFSAVPIPFDGRPCILAMSRDISERKKAEEQVRALLAESNQARLSLLSLLEDETRTKAKLNRIAMVIEQSAETILITDAKGLIQYVNPAFEAVTGYPAAEAIGQNPRLLKSGHQDEAFYRELWETISSGKIWKGRFVNRKKNGTLYTEEATISSVRDAEGTIVNYVAVKHDITEHLDLSAQLAQAQKMECVGQLAGGVAHDFNNLLMGIMGYTELCRDALDPNHPIQVWLDEITSESRRSAKITHQLLAFARKQIIAPHVLDLTEAVAGMLKMLQRLIREDIELSWKPGPEPLQIRIDPSQLDQILVNLVVNARDAIPGSGRLMIETRGVTLTHLPEGSEPVGELPGPFALLSVSDTGCGMDDEILAHIFEPFFTTKGVGQGTGLGLATVYGIVNQNKGYITVSSRPGEGTTFSIYFPMQSIQSTETLPSTTPAVCSRGQETILVVEDEKSVRFSVELFLKTFGYQVLVAANPQDALRQVDEHPGTIHLLITDVVLPGMNGRDLALKLQERHPTLKCIYMSGYTADVIAKQGILDADVVLITKPFTRQDLARIVREVLDR